MRKLGSVFHSALGLLVGFSFTSLARATEVLSVDDKTVEIRVTRDMSLSTDQLYYVLDNGNVRRGIVKIDSVVDDVAFGKLLMGDAEPEMTLELRTRKAAQSSRAGGSRSPASEGRAAGAEESSGYWWTPKAGRFSLETWFSMATGNYTIGGQTNASGTYAVNATFNHFGLNATYAFTPKFSMSASWQFANSATLNTGSVSTTTSGASDPAIGALYQNKDGDAVYYFGLGLSLGTSPETSRNFAAGGIGIAPVLGLQVHGGQNYFGTRLQYEYFLTRQWTSSSGNTTSFTGGNVFSMEMFYELHFQDQYLSPIFGFDSVEASPQSDPYVVPHWKLKYGNWFTSDFDGSISLLNSHAVINTGSGTMDTSYYGGEVTLRYQF